MADAPKIPESALFNGDALLGMASAITGLYDFGAEPIREAIERLLGSLRDEARLTAQGAQNEHLRLLKSLTDRLQIQAAIAAHPEILDESIERPLIITGLMRTGSTKLQRALATDPRWRHLPLWEAMNPVPFPGETAGNPAPRIEMTRAIIDGLRTYFPQAYAGHPMAAEDAEEETFCSQFLIQSIACCGFAYLPNYMAWAIGQSRLPPYRWLHRTLQYLQWRDGGERKRWLLKSPFHVGYLDDLFQVFPDATVVQTHRVPLVDVVASSAMLMHQHRSMSGEHSDTRIVGPEVLGYMSAFMRRHMLWRREHPDRILDVDYRDIVTDVAIAAHRIYDHAGMALTDAARADMAAWESRNVQHAHGRFIYDANEFGLNEAMVNAAFGDYAQPLA